MTFEEREAFQKKYNYHHVEKYCYSCKHSSGYIEWLECVHPILGENVDYPPVVEAYGVCNLWEEKPKGTYSNE